MAAIATLVLLATALTSCRGPYPSSVRFGYRWDDHGNIVIAYPICPAGKVSGAKITVRKVHKGKGSFETLWNAKDSAPSEVAQGVFTVGTSDSFRLEGRPLTKKLPEGFYIEVTEITRQGKYNPSRDSWIDQSVRPSSPLKAGEYLMSDGKTVSRKWVNDQVKFESAS